MSKIVYILRGLPGAGKSNIAAQIEDIYTWDKDAKGVIVCSADKYFVQNGQYLFDINKLGAAHAQCRQIFSDAIIGNYDCIIIDNTNTTHKEFKFYKDEGLKAGYQVQIITVGEFSEEALAIYAARNVHGVPIEKLKLMRDRFQL